MYYYTQRLCQIQIQTENIHFANKYENIVCTTKGSVHWIWQQYSIPKDRAPYRWTKRNIEKYILIRIQTHGERERDEKNIVRILCDTREYDCRALLTMPYPNERENPINLHSIKLKKLNFYAHAKISTIKNYFIDFFFVRSSFVASPKIFFNWLYFHLNCNRSFRNSNIYYSICIWNGIKKRTKLTFGKREYTVSSS